LSISKKYSNVSIPSFSNVVNKKLNKAEKYNTNNTCNTSILDGK